MKRLHLDFVAQAPRLQGLRQTLLGVGLLALAAVLAYYQFKLLPRTQTLEQELLQQQATLKPPTKASSMKPEELANAWRQAQEVSDKLNLPWSRLFAAMGQATSKEDLAFLSIEPDAIKGQVVVIAEARNFDAMLNYFRAMQANEDFADVTLQSHLINQTVAEKPVRFRLTARWKLAR